MLVGLPATEYPSSIQYRPVAAICQSRPVAEGKPLPCFGSVGTGGIDGAYFILNRQGYQHQTIVIVRPAPARQEVSCSPYVGLMEEVKAGFGRTMSHLPPIFGVSRQTLYNWMSGETPKRQHQEKLVQLAEAARVFSESRFKPTAVTLDRTVSNEKSFIELISEGANGRETALKLIRIVQRGTAARNKLDVMLAGRKSQPLSVADMGRQSFSDDV